MNENLTSKDILSAVMRLVSYADLYDYALTLSEICRDLPWKNIDEEKVKNCLVNAKGDFPVKVTAEGFLFLDGNEKLLNLRKRRKETSEMILRGSERIIRKYSNLPYVRTIALSGALAFENASESDDIDIFLIVQSNRLWLVDMYNLLVNRIWREKIRRCRNAVCPNYIVEDVALKINERNFFIAHQVKHMKPLYDEGCWDYFMDANDWVRDYFPSFRSYGISCSKPRLVKRILEIAGDMLGAGIINALIYAVRGQRLRRKKNLGLIRGSYNFRSLKANDCRRGSIAMNRLNRNLCRMASHSDGALLNDYKSEYEKNEKTVNCLSRDEEKSIEGFLNYYIAVRANTILPTENISVLSLPYISKNENGYRIWKIRAGNYIRVMGLIRELEPYGEGPILDLGAGNCWLSRRLIDDGYRAIACDICVDAPYGLSQADIFRNELGIGFERYRCLMENLPFNDESIKGVIASASFHYSQNPEMVLKEISRVLMPHGWAIIYDSPVFSNPHDGEATVLEDKNKYDTEGVLNEIEYQPRWFIDIRSFSKAAESSGLDIRFIASRNLIQRTLDRVKNVFKSKRRWAQLPIILLNKKKSAIVKQKNTLCMLRYFCYKLFVEGRLKPTSIFTIDGIKLMIPYGVFHPLPYDSSKLLLRAIKKRYETLEKKTVLDMGTGSGIHAIAASKLGARVTAADINPKAIKAAKINSELNGVGEKIEFIETDLFENIGMRKFDIVIFNPPFYEGIPDDISESAWKDKGLETFRRFINHLPDYLTQNGEAIVVLSDRSDTLSILINSNNHELSFKQIMKRRKWDETYVVFLIRKSK